jgi:cob(I)alamin adenosyltransferase
MPGKSKIYTKTGDLGETSLLGGTRVSKSHDRVEAYGTIDELNSFAGLIRDQAIHEHYKEVLVKVQENLFIAESWIAADPQLPCPKLPLIKEDDLLLLEQEIDQMNNELPPLAHFILPGGHPVASYCHIARTICRRAERRVIRIKGGNPADDIIITYLNRLSDYLFVLGRKVCKDLGGEEILWKTKE